MDDILARVILPSRGFGRKAWSTAMKAKHWLALRKPRKPVEQVSGEERIAGAAAEKASDTLGIEY